MKITVYRQSDKDTEEERCYVGVSETSPGYFSNDMMLDKTVSTLDAEEIVRKDHRAKWKAFLQ
jgi:hypothetical protein